MTAAATKVGEDIAPPVLLLPGETEIAAPQMSYDTFMANTAPAV